jgi:hypothetical protein|tara:strand:- start:1088 stop:1651 length:564 start_codon:yes stop_codon:yes gene_type:complete
MKENDEDFGLINIDKKDFIIKKKSNYFKYLILIIPIILIYYYFNKNLFQNISNEKYVSSLEKEIITSNLPIDSIKENNTRISADLSNTKKDSMYVNKDEIEKTKILKEDKLTGKYYIITGSFSNYNLSLKKANMLLNLGYQPIIILPINNNNMYRVGIDLFDDIETAKKSLKNYIINLNDKLWILKH